MHGMNLSLYLENQGRGSKSALARLIGVVPPDVTRWLNGERPVPLRHCAAIERVTNGVVSRRDLRPNDWQVIWPELAKEQ